MSSIYVFDAYGTLFDVHAAIAPLSRRGRARTPTACRKSGAASSSNTPGR